MCVCVSKQLFSVPWFGSVGFVLALVGILYDTICVCVCVFVIANPIQTFSSLSFKLNLNSLFQRQ